MSYNHAAYVSVPCIAAAPDERERERVTCESGSEGSEVDVSTDGRGNLLRTAKYIYKLIGLRSLLFIETEVLSNYYLYTGISGGHSADIERGDGCRASDKSPRGCGVAVK